MAKSDIFSVTSLVLVTRNPGLVAAIDGEAKDETVLECLNGRLKKLRDSVKEESKGKSDGELVQSIRENILPKELEELKDVPHEIQEEAKEMLSRPLRYFAFLEDITIESAK